MMVSQLWGGMWLKFWHVNMKIDTGIGEEDRAEAAEVKVRVS